MQTIQLDVPTIHCRSCKLNIEESLEELAGVDSSEVDVDAKRVAVTFDPAVVDAPAVIAAIEEAGYPVSR